MRILIKFRDDKPDMLVHEVTTTGENDNFYMVYTNGYHYRFNIKSILYIKVTNE